MKDIEKKCGYLKFPSNLEEAHTFEDCILIKAHKTYYIITEFRNGFLKTRISRDKYMDFFNERKN